MTTTASDPIDIFNWRRLDGRLTTSGQPREEQLEAIRALGVTRVINLALHTHEYALPDEAGVVAALGMRYVHIPVEFTAPAEDDWRRFVEAMAEAEGETLQVHCIANYRVSAFFYRYAVEVLGEDKATARARMETVWSPGGVWAAFIGDEAAVGREHIYARKGSD